MKVRVTYTSEWNDDARRALACWWGEHGRKATREEIQEHMQSLGRSTDDDMMDEYENCDQGCSDV